MLGFADYGVALGVAIGADKGVQADNFDLYSVVVACGFLTILVVSPIITGSAFTQ